MPVVIVAIPSVSRDAGTVSSISATLAMRVGEIAKPARNSTPVIAAKPSTNGSGTSARARASIPVRNRTALRDRQEMAPVSDPRQQAAQREHAEQRTGRGLRAELLRERDRGHLDAAEQHAEHAAGHDQRPEDRPAHRAGAVAAGGAGVRRGSGAALRGERQRAHQARGHRRDQPRQRVHRGGEHGDQDRAEHEDDLVDHRLERERGLQLPACRAPPGSTGPGRWSRSAAARHRRARRTRAAAACGQARSTATISRVIATVNARIVTGSTRTCPSRSVSRPCGMANTALAIRYAAATAPARP